MSDRRIIPIETLFGEAPDLPADPRDELADADVIVAVMGQKEVLIYVNVEASSPTTNSPSSSVPKPVPGFA